MYGWDCSGTPLRGGQIGNTFVREERAFSQSRAIGDRCPMRTILFIAMVEQSGSLHGSRVSARRTAILAISPHSNVGWM